MAQRSSACLIVMAVGCFAAVLGQTVPCRRSCQGGTMTWEGQHGPISCCPPDYTMTVVDGRCACHPAAAPGSRSGPKSVTAGNGDVAIADGYNSKVEMLLDIQRMRESAKQLVEWIRLINEGSTPKIFPRILGV